MACKRSAVRSRSGPPFFSNENIKIDQETRETSFSPIINPIHSYSLMNIVVRGKLGDGCLVVFFEKLSAGIFKSLTGKQGKSNWGLCGSTEGRAFRYGLLARGAEGRLTDNECHGNRVRSWDAKHVVQNTWTHMEADINLGPHILILASSQADKAASC